MSELYKLISMCKEKDDDSILCILNKFKPLINKYARLLNNDDSEQELILTLIQTLYKIPIHREVFLEDKYIISYINKSIVSKYISLSKQQSQKYFYEYEYDFNLISSKDESSLLELNDLLKDLTYTEKQVLVYKYVKQMSDIEIGRLINISRQAINQTKNRALRKLKNYI